MGRYDGEDYETVPPCRPGDHEFAMNGMCHRCRWTRQELVAWAHEIINLYAPVN